MPIHGVLIETLLMQTTPCTQYPTSHILKCFFCCGVHIFGIYWTMAISVIVIINHTKNDRLFRCSTYQNEAPLSCKRQQVQTHFQWRWEEILLCTQLIERYWIPTVRQPLVSVWKWYWQACSSHFWATSHKVLTKQLNRPLNTAQAIAAQLCKVHIRPYSTSENNMNKRLE